MSAACARWMALSDREAIGEEISAEESAFAREHAASCTSCGAEAALWSEMASLVDGPPAAAPKRERVEVAAPRASRRGLLVAAAVATLAAAAGLAFFVRDRGPARNPPVAPVALAPALSSSPA